MQFNYIRKLIPLISKINPTKIKELHKKIKDSSTTIQIVSPKAHGESKKTFLSQDTFKVSFSHLICRQPHHPRWRWEPLNQRTRSA